MKINVRELFLELTSRTYPNGTEHELEHLLPDGVQKDDFGNYFIEIGDNYTTMFTSHLDTACPSTKLGSKHSIEHIFTEDNKYVGTANESILGGDCKAGVVIMSNMIANEVPGLYYFFLGEEVGCLGSKWASIAMSQGQIFKDHKITKVVSFDRKGTSSIITYQWSGRCASDAFANSLISEFMKNDLVMEKDPTGLCTDSVEFQDFIPECTNISTGYYKEHTSDEIQDLEFLEKISEACVNIDWESLVVERDPSVVDYGNMGFWGNYMSGYGQEEEEEEFPSVKSWDSNFTTFISDPYSNSDNDTIEVMVSLERISYEKKIIASILESWGFDIEDPETLDWDGKFLNFSFMEDGSVDSIPRSDLGYSDMRMNSIGYDDIKLINKSENESDGDTHSFVF